MLSSAVGHSPFSAFYPGPSVDIGQSTVATAWPETGLHGMAFEEVGQPGSFTSGFETLQHGWSTIGHPPVGMPFPPSFSELDNLNLTRAGDNPLHITFPQLPHQHNPSMSTVGRPEEVKGIVDEFGVTEQLSDFFISVNAFDPATINLPQHTLGDVTPTIHGTVAVPPPNHVSSILSSVTPSSYLQPPAPTKPTGAGNPVEPPPQQLLLQPMESFTCSRCSRRFSTQQGLERHYAKHMNFLCQHSNCPRRGKSFLTKRDLERHCKSVHGESVTLPCGAVRRNRSDNLLRHARPDKCSTCSGSLNEILRIAGAEKGEVRSRKRGRKRKSPMI